MDITKIEVPFGFKPITLDQALEMEIKHRVDLKTLDNPIWHCFHNDQYADEHHWLVFTGEVLVEVKAYNSFIGGILYQTFPLKVTKDHESVLLRMARQRDAIELPDNLALEMTFVGKQYIEYNQLVDGEYEACMVVHRNLGVGDVDPIVTLDITPFN